MEGPDRGMLVEIEGAMYRAVLRALREVFPPTVTVTYVTYELGPMSAGQAIDRVGVEESVEVLAGWEVMEQARAGGTREGVVDAIRYRMEELRADVAG